MSDMAQYLVRKGDAAYETFLAAIDGFESELFDIPSESEGWSMRDLMAHTMANAQGHVVEIKAILGEGPGFDRKNRPWAASQQAALDAGFEASVEWMKRDYAEFSPFLKALTDDQLGLAAQTGHGQMTIEALLKHYGSHLKEHAEQAGKIRKDVEPEGMGPGQAQVMVRRGHAGVELFFETVETSGITDWDEPLDKGWALKDCIEHMAGNTRGHAIVVQAILSGTPMTEPRPWLAELQAVMDQGLEATVAWARAQHEEYKGVLDAVTDADLEKKGQGGKAASGTATLLRHYSTHGQIHTAQLKKMIAAREAQLAKA